MSQNEHEAGHESPIKTPKQLITVIVLAFLVPILIIVLLSQFVTNMRSVRMDSPSMAPDAVAKRLKPVGDLAFADTGGEPAAGPKSGEEIYKSVCSACHESGAAGSPKLGDKRAWASRLKEGQKMLVETAIKGSGPMPPRGGSAGLSDLEVERAVVFMVNNSGGKFIEPAAPAPVKTAAAAGAAGKPDGKKIYDATCTACHASGAAGAPKAGDKAAWAPRLKGGANALYASALKGKGAMPAKGGNAALADADVKAAVDYLLGLAK
jgi:cytochrome c5